MSRYRSITEPFNSEIWTPEDKEKYIRELYRDVHEIRQSGESNEQIEKLEGDIYEILAGIESRWIIYERAVQSGAPWYKLEHLGYGVGIKYESARPMATSVRQYFGSGIFSNRYTDGCSTSFDRCPASASEEIRKSLIGLGYQFEVDDLDEVSSVIVGEYKQVGDLSLMDVTDSVPEGIDIESLGMVLMDKEILSYDYCANDQLKVFKNDVYHTKALAMDHSEHIDISVFAKKVNEIGLDPGVVGLILQHVPCSRKLNKFYRERRFVTNVYEQACFLFSDVGCIHNLGTDNFCRTCPYVSRVCLGQYYRKFIGSIDFSVNYRLSVKMFLRSVCPIAFYKHRGYYFINLKRTNQLMTQFTQCGGSSIKTYDKCVLPWAILMRDFFFRLRLQTDYIVILIYIVMGIQIKDVVPYYSSNCREQLDFILDDAPESDVEEDVIYSAGNLVSHPVPLPVAFNLEIHFGDDIIHNRFEYRRASWFRIDRDRPIRISYEPENSLDMSIGLESERGGILGKLFEIGCRCCGRERVPRSAYHKKKLEVKFTVS